MKMASGSRATCFRVDSYLDTRICNFRCQQIHCKCVFYSSLLHNSQTIVHMWALSRHSVNSNKKVGLHILIDYMGSDMSIAVYSCAIQTPFLL